MATFTRRTRTGVVGGRAGAVKAMAYIRGGPELLAALRRVDKATSDEMLVRATKAGAEVLEKEWKERAAATVGLGPGSAHVVEAIESDARPGRIGATGIVRLGKESPEEGEAQPVEYGVLTEFGGRGHPARPTLRPAFDAVQGRMLDAMSDELRRLIEGAN